MKPHSLFKIYMPEEEDLADLLGYILLEAASEATVEDIFQVCVRGDAHVTVMCLDDCTTPQLDTVTL